MIGLRVGVAGGALYGCMSGQVRYPKKDGDR